jgi:hypothetical protein
MVLHRFAHQPWDERYKPGATHIEKTDIYFVANTACEAGSATCTF